MLYLKNMRLKYEGGQTDSAAAQPSSVVDDIMDTNVPSGASVDLDGSETDGTVDDVAQLDKVLA